jgi:ABC-type phosphate transport system permease subunit
VLLALTLFNGWLSYKSLQIMREIRWNIALLLPRDAVPPSNSGAWIALVGSLITVGGGVVLAVLKHGS